MRSMYSKYYEHAWKIMLLTVILSMNFIKTDELPLLQLLIAGNQCCKMKGSIPSVQ